MLTILQINLLLPKLLENPHIYAGAGSKVRGGAQKEQTDQNKRLECHKDANDDDDKDDDDKDLLC